jgi:2-keto-4-pentenoate hydratase
MDRPFVHRVRMVTGKDSNPLNEVELLCESLMDNGGVLRTGTVVTYVPSQSVLGLQPGDEIRLTEEQFTRLSAAFFAELEKRFLGA